MGTIALEPLSDPVMEPLEALGEWGAARLAVPGDAGTVVAVPLGSDEGFSGFTIDLVRDGRVRALANVGVADGSHGTRRGLDVHVWGTGSGAPSDVMHWPDEALREGFDDATGAWYVDARDGRAHADTPDLDGMARTASMALAATDPSRFGRYATSPMYVIDSLDGHEAYLFDDIDGDVAVRVTGLSSADVGHAVMALASGNRGGCVTRRAALRALGWAHEEEGAADA